MMMRGGMEDAAVIGGLMVVQLIYAGNSVLLSYLMSLGLNPLTVVVCFAAATSLFLSPLAFYFERSFSLFICFFTYTNFVILLLSIILFYYTKQKLRNLKIQYLLENS